MSEHLHQRMADPNYWGEPVSMPNLPFGVDFKDAAFSTYLFAIRAAQCVVELHGKAVRNGMVAETFSAGQELPIVPRARGLVRVVEDSMTAPYRPSWLRRAVFDRLYSPDDPEAFDRKALSIEADKLYDGHAAWTDVTTHDGRPARVRRTVYYMTGSKSGQQLEGIPSGELSASGHENNYVLPPLTVGQSYYRDRGETVVSKVVAADILTPGGKKVRLKPKKAKTGATRSVRPAFGM